MDDSDSTSVEYEIIDDNNSQESSNISESDSDNISIDNNINKHENDTDKNLNDNNKNKNIELNNSESDNSNISNNLNDSDTSDTDDSDNVESNGDDDNDNNNDNNDDDNDEINDSDKSIEDSENEISFDDIIFDSKDIINITSKKLSYKKVYLKHLGVKIKLSDDVRIFSGQKNFDWYGKVTGLYHYLNDGTKMIRTKWFFRRSDISPKGKKNYPHSQIAKRELFLTDLSDSNDLRSVLGKIRIPYYSPLKSKKKKRKWFLTYLYDHKKQIFKQLKNNIKYMKLNQKKKKLKKENDNNNKNNNNNNNNIKKEDIDDDNKYKLKSKLKSKSNSNSNSDSDSSSSDSSDSESDSDSDAFAYKVIQIGPEYQAVIPPLMNENFLKYTPKQNKKKLMKNQNNNNNNDIIKNNPNVYAYLHSQNIKKKKKKLLNNLHGKNKTLKSKKSDPTLIWTENDKPIDFNDEDYLLYFQNINIMIQDLSRIGDIVLIPPRYIALEDENNIYNNNNIEKNMENNNIINNIDNNNSNENNNNNNLHHLKKHIHHKSRLMDRTHHLLYYNMENKKKNDEENKIPTNKNGWTGCQWVVLLALTEDLEFLASSGLDFFTIPRNIILKNISFTLSEDYLLRLLWKLHFDREKAELTIKRFLNDEKIRNKQSWQSEDIAQFCEAIDRFGPILDKVSKNIPRKSFVDTVDFYHRVYRVTKNIKKFPILMWNNNYQETKNVSRWSTTKLFHDIKIDVSKINNNNKNNNNNNNNNNIKNKSDEKNQNNKRILPSENKQEYIKSKRNKTNNNKLGSMSPNFSPFTKN